jgi:ribonuclease VapC
LIVDTSALAAILFQERDALAYARALLEEGGATISAANLVELTMVVEGRAGVEAGPEVDDFLNRFDISVFPVTRHQAELARQAWRRFGKGRHPAALNFGDCFSYALAIHLGRPLLFKGDDFARTDVKAAL